MQKYLSLRKLRRWIFGAKTEKTAAVIPAPETNSAPEQQTAPEQPPSPGRKRKPAQGHGRRGANDFPGAVLCPVHHTDYEAGQHCPLCPKGKLYPVPAAKQLRFEGQPPIALTIYEQAKLRCNLCEAIFTAPLPTACEAQKYAPSAVAMIALLKYGHGMPCYRLGQLQSALEVPLAPSTQWHLLNTHAPAPTAVHQALIQVAAQAPLLHNDDTTMRIVDLQREPGDTRTGIFTTGIVACEEDWQIALYFTGTHHAGENLAKVLEHRQPGLDPPKQMCDALERNLPASIVTMLGNCLTHGRRKFVDVIAQFPEECRFVLLIFSQVYAYDDHCNALQLSEGERLVYHQTHSAPKMEALRLWMEVQLNEHLVEPNSGLGKAIAYMRNHWDALTLFLREPGAPLDNNVCERILKQAILHRKNALFYKTEAGAKIGDIYMSLIPTCRLNRINSFDYLTAILKYASQVIANPSAWLPWNYKPTLAQIV
jgi:transposase